jgi:hypothetical protein
MTTIINLFLPFVLVIILSIDIFQSNVDLNTFLSINKFLVILNCICRDIIPILSFFYFDHVAIVHRLLYRRRLFNSDRSSFSDLWYGLLTYITTRAAQKFIYIENRYFLGSSYIIGIRTKTSVSIVF